VHNKDGYMYTHIGMHVKKKEASENENLDKD